MNVREIEPAVDADALLAGAQFADAFGLNLDLDGGTLDARQAAERMMGRAPQWIDALLAPCAISWSHRSASRHPAPAPQHPAT